MIFKWEQIKNRGNHWWSGRWMLTGKYDGQVQIALYPRRGDFRTIGKSTTDVAFYVAKRIGSDIPSDIPQSILDSIVVWCEANQEALLSATVNKQPSIAVTYGR